MPAPKGYSEKFDQETILAAIEGSGAIMSAVARNLGGVAWDTAERYVNKWAATRQAWKNEEEKILDLAENVLYRNIKDGDSGDAKWVLTKKGKRRGWADSLEITGKDGGAITIRWDDAADSD